MNIKYSNEIWKDIKGYEELYQISNFGRVKRKNYRNTGIGKILKNKKNSYGYFIVGLCENAKVKTFSVHRLVAQAFIPNPDNLPQVNHKDEDKTNNIVWINEDGSIDYSKTNLEWCDAKYNVNYGTGITRRARGRKGKSNYKLINGKYSKTVLQYDLEGNLIKEWPSLNEIKRVLNHGISTISKCCNKKAKTAYGFYWKYK